jgi:Domain of unknown function (DUF4976)
VANVDLAPTILDAANAVPGLAEDGRSLLPLLRDRSVEWGRDILLEDGQGANGVPAYRGLRTYRFKYVEHLTTGEYELYDLRKDPYELKSLDASLRYEPIMLDLRHRLHRLTGCEGRPCRARPSLKLRVRAAKPKRTSRRRSRRSARCVPEALGVRVTGAEGAKVLRADVSVAGKRVLRMVRKPLVRSIPRRRLPRGRRFLLRVRTTLRDGRVVTLDRRLSACR